MNLYFMQYYDAEGKLVSLSNVNHFSIEPTSENQRILIVRFSDNTVMKFFVYNWQVISGDLNDVL